MATPIHWIPAADRGKATTRRGPHQMTGKLKRLPWPYCVRCGLLALRNEATRKALRADCVTLEDS